MNFTMRRALIMTLITRFMIKIRVKFWDSAEHYEPQKLHFL